MYFQCASPLEEKDLYVLFLNEPLHLYSISVLVRTAKFLNPVISPYGNGPRSPHGIR